LVRDMRFKDVVVIDSASAVAGSALGVTLALTGFGVWSLVAMEGGRSVTRLVMAFWSSRWRPTANVSWSHLFDVGGINASVVVSAALAYVDRKGPRMIIAAFLGSQALGFYTIAIRLYEILTSLFVGPFSWVAMPVVTRTLGDPKKLNAMVKSALHYAS